MRPGLIGSRIRERRAARGLKQAELARRVGISPSYLNLIEHNRRKIGGKVLIDLARALEADVAALTEEVEAGLSDALRTAARDHRTAEVDRLDEFVSRFPGWAALLAEERERAARLEQTVAALTDRLTHDPFLSASLHDVLSAVTSIRSTSSILADEPDIEPVWRTRFHKNLNDDSSRLAESAEALVRYLDNVGDAEAAGTTPQDEFEAFLRARDYHFPELETDAGEVAAVIAGAPGLASAASRVLAEQFLTQYRATAAAMPLAAFGPAAAQAGYAPDQLARAFGVGLRAVFRRLATLPPGGGGPPIGLVTCDPSGTLTFRKTLEGFPLPRFGAACPLWPLYAALQQPMVPVRRVVELARRLPRRFLTYAVAEPVAPPDFDQAPVFEAAMLILPASAGGAEEPVQPVGTSCRICPRDGCQARREPTILAGDGDI